MLEIDTRGQIADTLVTAYTHRDLADEALRVVKLWHFTAWPHRAGSAVISTLALTFIFENTGTVVLERRGMSEPETPRPAEIYAYRPHGLATLDHPPTAITHPRPVYPKAWIEAGAHGFGDDQFLHRRNRPSANAGAEPSSDPSPGDSRDCFPEGVAF